jgi:hypothetical protein
MTTEVVSRMTTIARRYGPMWRHAGGRNPTSAPAAELEHELVVLSRHRTSEGVVTYARCDCGELQIWLTGAGRPAHTRVLAATAVGKPRGPGSGGAAPGPLHAASERTGRSPSVSGVVNGTCAYAVTRGGTVEHDGA